MAKMRIGLVCPYHIFRGGGVQECVLALQSELTRRGHYAKIITPLPRDYAGKIPDSIITLGASVNTKAFVGTAWQWSVSVDTDIIDQVLSRERFDILHFHEPWIPVWSRQLLWRSTSANVATMHGHLPDTMTAKAITSVVTPYTRPMLKYFDAFTAVSEPATEYLLSLRKLPITIVPNGIDLAKYSTPPSGTGARPKRHTVLYIGRLEKRKGVKYLLRAFAELAHRHSDVQLLVAGSGPEENRLREQVAENAIPRVTFLGYISDDQKIRHLHRADVFCSPAPYGESFGIVLLEAMAAGCPVVAGDNPGYVSVLRGSGAISLVNPQDSIDFARRLELLLFDKGLRELWRQWAARHVKQFDYPAVVDQYLNVYHEARRHHQSRHSA